jgi:hypothetical protein
MFACGLGSAVVGSARWVGGVGVVLVAAGVCAVGAGIVVARGFGSAAFGLVIIVNTCFLPV